MSIFPFYLVFYTSEVHQLVWNEGHRLQDTIWSSLEAIMWDNSC